MTHTVHPYAHRLGIIRDWKSRWFGLKNKFRESLKSDLIIRNFLENRLQGFYAGDILIERSRRVLRIIIETSRPGLIIGRSGEGAVKLRENLLSKFKKEGLDLKQEVKIDIKEIRSPETNAAIVSQMIAEGLEKRMPFRRVLKQSLDKIIANRDVKGAKIQLSGRLGGATMSRSESRKNGRIPLQTLRADIDFAKKEAHLPYGNIGIKVWIYKGDVFAKKPAERP
ncbi:MAG: 30S ribosomal protein S3 [Parcubacteria group bacterium Gr01-1014_107]|nr:MAG: 30S ribosomal protein S3 [Parcubacteria group bacterium Gr01-1014_107]